MSEGRATAYASPRLSGSGEPYQVKSHRRADQHYTLNCEEPQ